MSFGFYDYLSTAPFALYHLILFCLLLVLSIYIEKTIRLKHVLALCGYFLLPFIINYPFLMHRDVYLHGRYVRQFMTPGFYGQPSEATQWPLSFLEWAIFSLVVGLDPKLTNTPLFVVLMLIFPLILYCFAKKIKRNFHGSTLILSSSLLFFIFLMNHRAYMDMFARQYQALMFLVLAIYLFYAYEKSRKILALNLLITASIVMMHPFTASFLAVFCVSYLLIRRKNSLRIPLNFTFVYLVIYAAWWVFQAYVSLPLAVEMFSNIFNINVYKPIAESVYILEDIPAYGQFFRNYFKLTLVAMSALSAMALVMLYKKKQFKKFQLIFISLTVGALSLAPLLVASVLWIDRIIVFAALPVSFLAPLGAFMIIGSRKDSNIVLKKVGSAVAISLLALTLFTSGMLVYERNFYDIMIPHNWNDDLCVFIDSYAPKNTWILGNWKSMIYLSYYDFNEKFMQLPIESEEQLFQRVLQSDLILETPREKYTLDPSKTLEENMRLWNLFSSEYLVYYNKIYSNGYTSAYLKP